MTEIDYIYQMETFRVQAQVKTQAQLAGAV